MTSGDLMRPSGQRESGLIGLIDHSHDLGQAKAARQCGRLVRQGIDLLPDARRLHGGRGSHSSRRISVFLEAGEIVVDDRRDHLATADGVEGDVVSTPRQPDVELGPSGMIRTKVAGGAIGIPLGGEGCTDVQGPVWLPPDVLLRRCHRLGALGATTPGQRRSQHGG